ncbi:hypothetical protein ACIGZJ_12035 [Kitasatospora sp. NPDC052868]|uniref:hypothetical protein n=1 Tax=Kitasatospora sp. NPDC052868 TaxID=3364060 RepID=UPI0037C964E8
MTGQPEQPEQPASDDTAAETVTVADYWRGAFTLGAAGPDDPEEPSLRRLGPSGITVRGSDLADLLAPAYVHFRA